MAVKYTPDRNGARELARSAGVGGATLAAGRSLAAAAEADNPRGSYAVTPRTVTGGWANEHRSGAAVVEVEVGRGAQRRTLARISSGGGQ